MSAAGVTNIPQQGLTLVGGLNDDLAEQRLRRVVWAAPRDENGNVIGAPGLHDLGGTRRTALVNDLTKFGIAVEIRLRSLDDLRRVMGDPHLAALTVKGPSANSTVADLARMQEWTITTEWQPFPPAFANWLDYERSTNKILGASHTIRRRVKEIGDGGEVAYSWKNIPVRPTDLFEFRMAGDTLPRLVRDQPVQEMARDWQQEGAVAALRAELAAMRREMESLRDTPPAFEAGPVVERDDAYTPDGGIYLAVPERAPAFDGEDEGEASEAELAKVATQLGGTVKGGKRR